MAEEAKKESCTEPKKVFSTILKVILGLVFLGLGCLAILKWWGALLLIVRGSIGLFLLLAGVITLAIAKE